MKRILIVSIIVLGFIVIGVLGYFYYVSTLDGVSGDCVLLGCSSDSIYIGSVNSDKYYSCDCHYADRIKSENIICFSSDEEAVSLGYSKIDC